MSFRRIVIGIDFSASSASVARWIVAIAPDAEVVLVHAIDVPPEPRTVVPSPWAREFEAAARARCAPLLDDVARSVASVRSTTALRVGRPHEVLSAVAEESGADLIVVGAHGHDARPWHPLGTTADRLVRTARIPVLIGTAADTGVPRRLLVGVDDADPLPELLALTRALCDAFEAHATLVHVFSTAVMGHMLSTARVTSDSAVEAQARVEGRLQHERRRWREIADAHGLPTDRVEVIVTHGDPGDVLLAQADALTAQLIVLGREGSGGVLPLLLGRTVSTVLRGARCAVLIVPRARRDP